jgi:hypothetical protein
MQVDIIERNPGTYLQAGDAVKPQFYFAAAAVFWSLAVLWIGVVCTKKCVLLSN